MAERQKYHNCFVLGSTSIVERLGMCYAVTSESLLGMRVLKKRKDKRLKVSHSTHNAQQIRVDSDTKRDADG